MDSTNYITWIIVFIHLSLSVWAITHTLLHKNDHIVAFGWISTCLFFPIFGSLSYFIFGINRIQTRAKRIRNSVVELPTNNFLSDINILNKSTLPPQSIATAHLSYANRFSLKNNNTIKILYNGEEAYPSMLNAINKAKHYVLLSTYIFENDETGNLFVEALSEAKKRGVKIYVLIDGLGVKYGKRGIQRTLRKKGIKVYLFLKIRLLPPSIYFNLRNHRKLLIIDGINGFTGGMNISNNHMLTSINHQLATQDIHFRFSGEILNDFIQIFREDWEYSSRKKIILPIIQEHNFKGPSICRAVSDGPNEDFDILPILINGLISCATKNIQIMTPYFIPSRELISALQAASMRGVVVNIVLPEINNIKFVHWASQKCFSELVKYNVNIYYQPAPFAHTKLLIIDDYYSMVGSANIDPRSLMLNFEIIAEIFDLDISDALNKHIYQAITKSKKVNQAWLDKQNTLSKLRNSLVWLFSSFL